MTDIHPDILEEVEDCIRRVKAFQEAQGRRIHRDIKRSRKGREGLAELAALGLTLPEDFRALYHNHNGIRFKIVSQWEQNVLLDYYWPQIDQTVLSCKIQQVKKRRGDGVSGDRLEVLRGIPGTPFLDLDFDAVRDGAMPLLMNWGRISRRNYIGFDSTLAMLRSVCAAQDAGILRYRTEREGDRERSEIDYDPRALWDVIRPFNPRADYWPALIAGTLDWDMIELPPSNGIIPRDPEIDRLIWGEPGEYQRKWEEDRQRRSATRRKRQAAALLERLAQDQPKATETEVLFDGEIFADHHQFHLADINAEIDLGDDWVGEAMDTRIHCRSGVLVVTTARDMPVPVRVELHDAEPAINLEMADHVVLGKLRTSGRLVIAGPTDSFANAPRIPVPKGMLQAMVVFTGLGTLSEDGLDGQDRYSIHLWPGRGGGITVLREWDGD
ncbi:hypothetical protein [Plastoroseomonas hellenica]|uniref:hypothetical protein n=1 Tax=Plastoroseomonas hellenica TaxID=2687306 RepID=UPI001BAB0FFF|nr:hypothetical protein [Plastoroseomonas hellenica]MBR0643737.1 hypothetical protein [Plastoroseomonas hellenica]